MSWNPELELETRDDKKFAFALSDAYSTRQWRIISIATKVIDPVLA